MMTLALVLYGMAARDLQAANTGAALVLGAEFLRLRCATLAGLGSLLLAAAGS